MTTLIGAARTTLKPCQMPRIVAWPSGVGDCQNHLTIDTYGII